VNGEQREQADGESDEDVRDVIEPMRLNYDRISARYGLPRCITAEDSSPADRVHGRGSIM
jgi:hypothetical protein